MGAGLGAAARHLVGAAQATQVTGWKLSTPSCSPWGFGEARPWDYCGATSISTTLI
jgi:hypothetical protein